MNHFLKDWYHKIHITESKCWNVNGLITCIDIIRRYNLSKRLGNNWYWVQMLSKESDILHLFKMLSLKPAGKCRAKSYHQETPTCRPGQVLPDKSGFPTERSMIPPHPQLSEMGLSQYRECPKTKWNTYLDENLKEKYGGRHTKVLNFQPNGKNCVDCIWTCWNLWGWNRVLSVQWSQDWWIVFVQIQEKAAALLKLVFFKWN